MAMVRRRPMLRAAAIGGGVFSASKRRREAAARERAEQARIQTLKGGRIDPIPAPGAPARSAERSDETIDKLERLGRLRDQGVLTDDELAEQKGVLLTTGLQPMTPAPDRGAKSPRPGDDRLAARVYRRLMGRIRRSG